MKFKVMIKILHFPYISAELHLLFRKQPIMLLYLI